MNNLGREILQGEVVVLSIQHIQPEKKKAFAAPRSRAFICKGKGFGMYPNTSGGAIFGHWYENGEEATKWKS